MILCIDTITECSGVAIVSEKQTVYLPLDTRSASEKLIRTIDQVIQKVSIRLSDLKGVMVIKGPGSFTGLRVGIAIANQFAHQLSIPIIGLQTDEWYSLRTDEDDFIYFQSMNRDQLYCVGFGVFERSYPQSILSISECHHEFVSVAGIRWLGQVSEDHRAQFTDTEEIKDLSAPNEAWRKASITYPFSDHKRYALIEPYYGKEPTITKGKPKIK